MVRPRVQPALLLALVLLIQLSAAPDVAELFGQLDVANGGNGQLSKLELRRASASGLLAELGLPADDVLLAGADLDSNGMVSEAELQTYLDSSRSAPPAPAPAKTGGGPRSFIQHTTCEPCVAAGFGWNSRLGKCGGYANKVCDKPSLPTPTPTNVVAEHERTRQQLEAALSIVDSVLKQEGVGRVADGGDVDAKIARARELLHTRPPENHVDAAACSADASPSGKEEWQPSTSELRNWQPKISPFAWTPLWSAPTSSQLDLDALRAYIYNDRKTNAGLSKSNDGGFHSAGDLLDGKTAIRTPVLKAFREEIYRHVHAHLRTLAIATVDVGGPGETTGTNRPYRITIGTAWYNLNDADHYNNLHTHDGSHISGVLYLDDGGDITACTQFYDVRGQKAELGPQRLGGGDAAGLFRPVFGGTNAPVQICPQVGTLVLFPAWLQHAVLPHKGNRTRLTVSWNLVLEERRPGAPPEKPVDLDWPTALSNSDDRADSLALAGGEQSIPMWNPRGGLVGDLPPGGVPAGSALVPRGLSMYWPTPIRPNVIPHEYHTALGQLRNTLLRFEKKANDAGLQRGRQGWLKQGVLSASSASGVLPGIYREIYWYVYEMLLPRWRRSADGQAVAMDIEIVDSWAHVLRPGEHILAAARGDAEICGLLSLDVGMKVSGRDSRRNDMEFIDPRPMFSGTSTAYRGTEKNPASLCVPLNARRSASILYQIANSGKCNALPGAPICNMRDRYYWEMTNLGGRKLSYGLVPNLLVIVPCWMKYDIVPETAAPSAGEGGSKRSRQKEGMRTLVTFAARAKVARQVAVAGATAAPVLRTPQT